MNLVFKHFCYQYFIRKREVYEHNPTKEENDKNLKIVVVWETTTILTPTLYLSLYSGCCKYPVHMPFPWPLHHLQQKCPGNGTSFLQRLCNNITSCKVLQLTFRCANKTFDTDPVIPKGEKRNDLLSSSKFATIQ